MAFSRQSGCEDQGQLMGPCPPKPSDPFLDAAGMQFWTPQGRILQVTCKADKDRALGVVRGGQVVMVHSDPKDPAQQWYMENADGRSAFCLYRATKKALAHESKADEPKAKEQVASFIPTGNCTHH